MCLLNGGSTVADARAEPWDEELLPVMQRYHDLAMAIGVYMHPLD